MSEMDQLSAEELGIIASEQARETNFDSDAVAEIVKPQPAVGVKENVRAVWRPDITGQVVALAMVAVLLGVALAVQVLHLRGAHQHVCLPRSGNPTSINSPPSR